jgi:periplasmic copper chaperone A
LLKPNVADSLRLAKSGNSVSEYSNMTMNNNISSGNFIKLWSQFPAAIALTGAAFLHITGGLAYAQEYRLGMLEIDRPWLRVTIPGRPAAGYVIVTNKGKADRITAVSSPLAGRIEIHTTTMKGGIMRMRPVKQIDVPENGRVEFKTGGPHLMVLGVKQSFKSGDNLPITVVFEKAGAIEIKFTIKGLRDKINPKH